VKEHVLRIRQKLPRIGGRKLHYLLGPILEKENIDIGRDKLFSLLREEHLLLPKRKKYFKTTNSKHWMRKYPNLIQHIEIKMPEQVWVADITYLQASNKHYYLHLITDAYSKKIMGYNLTDNLAASSTTTALKKALSKRIYDHSLIHHSDRGLQYCSSEYTDLLKKNNILISMTESYDPYENAVAERINGILKDEFLLDSNFKNFETLESNVYQAIALYNQIRPHFSIELLTPNKAHKQSTIKLKSWKKQTPFI